MLAAFESVGTIKPSFSFMLSVVLGMILPGLSTKIPNKRTQAMRLLASGIRELANELLDKATKEKDEVGAVDVDKSIIGALGEQCLSRKETLRNDGC